MSAYTNGKVLKWIQENSAKVYTFDDCFFAVLPGEEADIVKSILPKIDKVLDESLLLKNSTTTTAGLVAVGENGNPLFFKRTNNKGLRFTLRYLFRPARVFRAAMAASELKKIGIITPEPLAVGERRYGWYLKAGYLVTTSRNAPHAAGKIFMETVDVDMVANSFLVQAGRIAAKMHRAGMIHGDLKLNNFYYCGNWTSDSEFGVWDLDGVRSFKQGSVPVKYVERELARILSSILIEACKNPSVRVNFCNPPELCAKLLEAYSRHAGKHPLPEVASVAKLAFERWQRDPASQKYMEHFL